jgi:hypothetical protein
MTHHSTEPWERFMGILERYGYGLSLAAALLWFARVDIIVPMVASHTIFLETMAETNKTLADSQAEIARNVAANTRLLIELREKLDEQR